MSAGFCVSFFDVLKRDIRHVYSGKPPSEINFRSNVYHQGIDITDRIYMDQVRPRSSCGRNTFEYVKEYDTALPRAPAFQRLSRTDVAHVVERLYSRKIQEQRQLMRRTARLQTRSAPPGLRTSRAANFAWTQKDVNSISLRLYSEQTHCSTARMRPKGSVIALGAKMGNKPGSSSGVLVTRSPYAEDGKRLQRPKTSSCSRKSTGRENSRQRHRERGTENGPRPAGSTKRSVSAKA